MTYEEWDLTELWNAVVYTKHAYIRARNAREPSTTLWNEYAKMLHAYRLRRRSLRDA
jgi:hypothetical protein